MSSRTAPYLSLLTGCALVYAVGCGARSLILSGAAEDTIHRDPDLAGAAATAVDEEALSEIRMAFTPSTGMFRGEVEAVLGEPRFHGVSKAGNPFAMYEVSDRRWRTVEFDREGRVLSIMPPGPMPPAGARKTDLAGGTP